MFISSSNPILTLGRLSQRTYFAPAGKSGQAFCWVHCQERKGKAKNFEDNEHLCFALDTLQKCHIKVIELNWLLRVQKRQQDWFKILDWCLPPYAPLPGFPNFSVPATDSPHKLPIPNRSQRQLNLMSHIKHILQIWGLLGLWLNLDNLKPPQRPHLASGSGYASIWKEIVPSSQTPQSIAIKYTPSQTCPDDLWKIFENRTSTHKLCLMLLFWPTCCIILDHSLMARTPRDPSPRVDPRKGKCSLCPPGIQQTAPARIPAGILVIRPVWCFWLVHIVHGFLSDIWPIW